MAGCSVDRSLQLSGWAKLVRALSSPASSTGVRPLILAAHPDDETIGASALIMRSPGAVVVYLTDGAPRDRNLRSPDANGSRSDYVRIRVLESLAALQVAGLPRDQIVFLGGVDQEAILEAVPRALYLASLLQTLRPDVVVTHSYEGGHPDHDSAALIARMALQIFHPTHEGTPDLLEMTSYHARDGMLITGQFHRAIEMPCVTIKLLSEEKKRKQLMMQCYRSQWRVLRNFSVDTEMLRLAPLYDFGQPPHTGKLWYECMGWKTTGAQWRAHALAALAEMEHACV